MKKLSRYIFTALFSIFLVIWIFPLLFLFIMSFSNRISEFNFTLDNYIYFFTSSGKFFTYLKNSFIVAVGSGLIQIPICLPGGYVLARHKSKLINFINAFSPLSILIPWTVILVSVLMFYLRIGLYDSLIGLILHHASFSSLFIAWIYGTFISSIPIEIEEAAELDGCSRLRIIFQIDMPLIIEGIAASFIWVFVNVWNTFLVAAFLIESTENIVFAQALYNALTYLLSGGMLNLNYAATIIFIIPPLILFIIFRRWITRILVY